MGSEIDIDEPWALKVRMKRFTFYYSGTRRAGFHHDSYAPGATRHLRYLSVYRSTRDTESETRLAFQILRADARPVILARERYHERREPKVTLT